ncbi:MAG: hypothetical protein NTY37_11095 [Methanothrix sp.]|nr:hypothetical protein [Methanothrix sp.]
MIKRTLIVKSVNLIFPWQREMQDMFRERFEILRGEFLRSNALMYLKNKYQLAIMHPFA